MLIVIEVTGRESVTTETVVKPIAVPLSSNIAILADPVLRPVTTPLFTEAIDSLDESHVMFALLTPAGKTGVSLIFLPTPTPALGRKELFAGGVVGTVGVAGAGGVLGVVG